MPIMQLMFGSRPARRSSGLFTLSPGGEARCGPKGATAGKHATDRKRAADRSVLLPGSALLAGVL